MLQNSRKYSFHVEAPELCVLSNILFTQSHHYKLNGSCIACDCYSVGSKHLQCVDGTGQCMCKSGVLGRQCNACGNKHAEVRLRKYLVLHNNQSVSASARGIALGAGDPGLFASDTIAMTRHHCHVCSELCFPGA